MQPARPGHEHHHRGDDEYAAGGGEVRLQEDEQKHRPRDDEQRHKAGEELAHVPPRGAEGAGEEEDHRVLGHLRGLEAHRPQTQPAPRAVEQLANAGDGHEAEQHKACHHQGSHHRRMGELAVVDLEDDGHQHSARANAGELGGDFREGVALILRVVVAGGVQYDQAEGEQREEGEEHAPVDAAGQAILGSRPFTVRLNSRPRAS